MTLPKLIADANRLAETLMESGGELTPEIEQELLVNEKDLAKKVDSYAVIIDRFEMEAEFLNQKAREIQAQAKAIENARDRLKDNLKFAMRTLGANEIKGGDFKFKLSDGRPKMVIDQTSLPDDFKTQIVVYETDKDKIHDAIAAGLSVKGVTFEPTFTLRKSLNRREK